MVCLGADQIKTSKHRVIGLCRENSPVTGEFPAQKASNAENVSIWWRYHAFENTLIFTLAWCISKSGLNSTVMLPVSTEPGMLCMHF